MINYFKYLLFIFIIFITPNCFAQSLDISSMITSPTGGSSSGGKYTGTELNGSRGPFDIGTRYNGTLTKIEFNLPFPTSFEGDCFWTNMQYTVTMNMATQDWRNRFGPVKVSPFSNSSGNFSNGRVTFVSMKKIYFTFTVPNSDTTCHETLYVTLNSSDLFTPFTGETNWNLSSVVLSDTYNPDSGGSSGGGSSGGGSSTPTPTPDASNQDIIDSNTSNTSDIIDNQNNNTSDIIDNNNQNTEELLENQSCPVGPLRITRDDFTGTFGKYLDSQGNEIDNLSYSITPYFIVKPNIQYTLSVSGGSLSGSTYLCYYTTSKAVRSCLALSTSGTSGVINFTTDQYTSYIRISLGSRIFSLKGPICNDWEKEGLKDIADAIKDDNIDDKTGFFTNFDYEDHGLTSIISLPLQFIQSLTSETCSPLQIPIPYTNRKVNLPCMTEVYQQRIPTIFNIWQVVSFGIISYLICLDIFRIVKGFKDPTEDKVEVLDL